MVLILKNMQTFFFKFLYLPNSRMSLTLLFWIWKERRWSWLPRALAYGNPYVRRFRTLGMCYLLILPFRYFINGLERPPESCYRGRVFQSLSHSREQSRCQIVDTETERHQKSKPSFYFSVIG